MSRLRLPIHEPCDENWNAMHERGESRRFCERCSKEVHDLSSMTEARAREVLHLHGRDQRMCVRYRVDAGGEIQFARPTTPAPSAWRMTLAAAALAAIAVSGCTDGEPDRIEAERCVHEVGPWSFATARGQGTCPAAPEEIRFDPVLPREPEAPEGAALLGVLSPPEVGSVPDPSIELVGDIAPDPIGSEEPCVPDEDARVLPLEMLTGEISPMAARHARPLGEDEGDEGDEGEYKGEYKGKVAPPRELDE